MASKSSKHITSPVGEKLFHNGKLISEDCEVTLPNIQPITESIQAMGTIDVPLLGLLQDMEFAIKLIGITKHYGEISTLAEKHTFDYRWVDINIGPDGSQTKVGKKAFLSGWLKSSGAPNLKVSESTEVEASYSCTEYKLIDDGKVIFDFNRFAKKCIINGKNYYDDIEKCLN